MSAQHPTPQPRTSKSSNNVKGLQIKSKDSSKCTSPTKSEEKKLPPIKAPVGLAKGPDLKNVKSKVGSFQNMKHVPVKGEKKVLTQKLEWKASSKIGSLDYAHHRPGGGDKKMLSQKLEWKASSRIGSLENVKHRPGGGTVRIFNERYSGRSVSEVRRPRQPSQVRATSPNILNKVNGESRSDSKTQNNNSAKLNQEQKIPNSATGHSSRISSGVNAQTNGIQQKQSNKLINDLENLSIKPAINNVQKTAPTDLLS